MSDQHCDSCTCGKRAPLQGEYARPATKSSPAKPARANGTISWAEHLECYAGYAAQHSGQSAETLASRGGFGWWEFVHFTGHEPLTWSPR